VYTKAFTTQRLIMSDSTQTAGGQDRKRINVNQDYELRDWSQKFGVTQDELRAAVRAVGDQADKVKDYLARGGSTR
jgi:hypothetical protein